MFSSVAIVATSMRICLGAMNQSGGTYNSYSTGCQGFMAVNEQSPRAQLRTLRNAIKSPVTFLMRVITMSVRSVYVLLLQL